MKLRKYQKEDADVICSWIQDEKSLYQWSSDRLGKFPLSGDDLNEHYRSVLPGGRFIPMTAVDESGRVTGHFLSAIRMKRTTARYGLGLLSSIRPSEGGETAGKC